MNEFFTWAALGTYAGATVLTMMVTQLFKGVRFIEQIPTRLFAYLVALIVLLMASIITGTLSFETGSLAAINAVVVALAASGGYDAVMVDRDKSGEDLE
jgi:phosphoglycerol transferase MdoB-like AlkP superfamily enzyme